MEERLTRLKTLLKIEEKEQRIAEIEQAMQKGEFWNDHEQAGQISQELTKLKETVEDYRLVELQRADPEAKELIKKLEYASLFYGEYDSNNAIVSIHAGAGGTEAQDWASMLLRMYERYVERKNWQPSIVDLSSGEEAGIKSVTLEVKGFQAFGHLKSEAGVHRLVRISPFDADKARHTSFALVEVIPEVGKNEIIDIKPDELKIDVYRSGGHGGQSVNTTDSAVRITHLPTGIIVVVQNERSQIQNKELAMKILHSRIVQKKLEEQRKKAMELRGEHISAEWGNQIRSYVLHPYQMVKDHRTGAEISTTQAVLNGELDALIDSYLHWRVREK